MESKEIAAVVVVVAVVADAVMIAADAVMIAADAVMIAAGAAMIVADAAMIAAGVVMIAAGVMIVVKRPLRAQSVPTVVMTDAPRVRKTPLSVKHKSERLPSPLLLRRAAGVALVWVSKQGALPSRSRSRSPSGSLNRSRSRKRSLRSPLRKLIPTPDPASVAVSRLVPGSQSGLKAV